MKAKNIIFFLALTLFLIGCQQKSTTDNFKTRKGITKVMILYPNGEGKTFDMDYYSKKHMPMVASLLGASLKSMSIDQGIAGRSPDEPMPYLAIGYLYFDKLSDYQNSFGPNAEKIVGDIPNYTNVQPIIQINEVFE